MATWLLLDILHQQAQKSRNLLIIVVVNVAELFSLVTLPVLLVFCDLVKQVSLLLDLVMSDLKLTALQRDLRVLHTGCNIWCLEANEGTWCAVAL